MTQNKCIRLLEVDKIGSAVEVRKEDQIQLHLQSHMIELRVITNLHLNIGDNHPSEFAHVAHFLAVYSLASSRRSAMCR